MSSPDPTYAMLRDLAARAARAAGVLARDGRAGAAGRLGGVTKSSPTDLVTEFDGAAERLIVDVLREARPDDAIVGEEGASREGTSGFAWHVDPIDGTTNFAYGLTEWSCSIGVTHDTGSGPVTVAGAVYVPDLDEMYTAAAGHGAFRDDRPIAAGTLTDVSLALVATGFGYDPRARVAQARLLGELIGEVRDVRRSGSAAVDLCRVACGRVDVYYESGLNSWDITAGELICREAGAVTSDGAGGPAHPGFVLAAAPGVHDEFAALLARAAERSR